MRRMLSLGKRHASLIAFLLVMAVLLGIGRYTYQDYGYTVDEDAERLTCLVNYKHAFRVLFDRDLEELDVPPMEEHKDRYYGVALQLPMVAAEHLTGFTMPLTNAYHLRHLYTFVLCMAGWACFYGFLHKVFKNRWLALAGLLMVVLYPRFYSEQFTNMKDMVFAAACAAELYAIALCLEHEEKWRYDVLAAFIGAVCVNTRFLGLMLPGMLFGYRILRDSCLAPVWKDGGMARLWKNIARYAAQLLMLLFFYYLITPAMWTDPIGFLPNVIRTFSNYDVWQGEVLYLGQYYPCDGLPWHYIPVWLAVSAPIWYLLLMGAGIALLAARHILRVRSGQEKTFAFLTSDTRYAVLCLVFALAPFLAMVLGSTSLYNGWRHVYFIFPPVVVLALFGLRALWRLLAKKCTLQRLLALAVCLLMAGQGAWIANAHPLEKFYFNPIGVRLADGMDRDTWFETNTYQLEYILARDDSHRISVWGYDFVASAALNFLPAEKSERLYVPVDDIRNAEYVIDIADTVGFEAYEGFTPVQELRTPQGVLISTIFLRDDVLQERFGGAYPG